MCSQHNLIPDILPLIMIPIDSPNPNEILADRKLFFSVNKY